MDKTIDTQQSSTGSGCLRLVGLILGGMAALVVIALVLLWIVGSRAKAELQVAHPPPGEWVDADGHEMHIHCQGEGTPTVILEAGSGGFSPHWVYVQPEVAEFTRVCAYDRSGMGWSEASPQPPTARVVVTELHTLLNQASIPGPYVLVGHSLGGLYVRMYAHQYPDAVVGMVLVDSVHEEQQLRAPEAVREWEEEFDAQLQQQLSVARLISASGLMALGPEFVPSDPDLPPETDETVRALIAANPEYFDTQLAVGDTLDETYEQARAAEITTLGDMPLVVIARGKPQSDPSIGLTDKVAQQYEPVWREMQRDLAGLSTNGELVIAEQSGHDIHVEQPEMVIDAIREVVTAARR